MAYLIRVALSLLSCFGFTRSADRTARKTVRSALKRNSVRRELEYGWCYRALLWGGHQPLSFAAVIGGLSLLVTWCVGPHESFGWTGIPLPLLEKDYDHATFFGTAWTVQATMVALVYPLVVSFIAIMLQRRATAKVALSVYLLDSAILPAGASSIALVGVMTVEYFVSPYLAAAWIVPGMVFNCFWFVINIGLTGYFLARTVRFIQDEEGQEAFLRIAVNSVLSEQLVRSLKTQLVLNEPRRSQWDPTGARAPKAGFIALGRGQTSVARKLSGPHVLTDVHLALVAWVGKRWLKRVNPLQSGSQREPLIYFPTPVAESAKGNVPLCVIDNGPALTFIERLAIKYAFVFRRGSRRIIAQTTEDMLTELATEVQSLAEQHRYSASVEALRIVRRMHATLLASCEENSEDEPSNAAALAPATLWNPTSHHGAWLSVYRPLLVLGVKLLEEDQSLFRNLAHVPAGLNNAVPNQPSALLAASLTLLSELEYHLGVWWTRQVQLAAPLPSGARATRLSEPLAGTYDKALISFVGAWSGMRFEVLGMPATEQKIWHSHCNRAKAYMAHLDGSARLLLQAISRGDEAAANLFSDQFLKWWGNNQYELKHGDLDVYSEFDNVRVSLVQHDLQTVLNSMPQMPGIPVTIELATYALALGVRRYWDSMRVVVIALLAQEGPHSAINPLQLRVAASLLQAKEFHSGGRNEAAPFDRSTLFCAILDLCFEDGFVTARLNEFCESLRWENRGMMVPGWTYSGTAARTDVESMSSSYVRMLVAVSSSPLATNVTEKIYTWWKNVRKLDEVATFGRVMRKAAGEKTARHNLLIGNELALAARGVTLGVSDRLEVGRGCSQITKVAKRERVLMLRSLQVDPQTLAEIAKGVAEFATTDHVEISGAYPFCRLLNADPGATASSHSLKLRHTFTREELTNQPISALSESTLRYIAYYVRHMTVETAVQVKLVTHHAPTFAADDICLLKTVAQQCAALIASGRQPVILVPHGVKAAPFRPYNWNRPGKPSLPANVRLTAKQAASPTFAEAILNDVAIVLFNTPSHGVFVVPSDVVTEAKVLPSSTGELLTPTFTIVGDNEVDVVFSWMVVA